MAVAFGHAGGAGNGAGGSTSNSWTHDCTGDTYLTVGLAFRGNVSSINVTYNSVAMTLIGSQVTGGDGLEFVYVYGLANPTTGGNTVSVTWTTSSRCAGASLSFSGAGITNTVTTGNSTGTDLAITASPAPGGSDLLCAYVGVDDNTVFLSTTVGTQQKLQGQADTNFISIVAVTNTTASINVHSSVGGDGFVGVAFPVLAGGGASTHNLSILGVGN